MVGEEAPERRERGLPRFPEAERARRDEVEEPEQRDHAERVGCPVPLLSRRGALMWAVLRCRLHVASGGVRYVV